MSGYPSVIPTEREAWERHVPAEERAAVDAVEKALHDRFGHSGFNLDRIDVDSRTLALFVLNLMRGLEMKAL